uniref:Secreted protein n=1 Tax=Ascaris lumbricoides TaxID=6252 RepID=A0A0M3HQN1_ASCLU
MMSSHSSFARHMLRTGIVLIATIVFLSAPALAREQDKRDNWNKALGLWGKRSISPQFLDTNLEKRSQDQWNKLNSLWGKRTSWQTANGLWGKRSSWETANGLWGKRSLKSEQLDDH